MSLRIVVLISGTGTNLQALIDRAGDDSIEGRIVAVVSDKDAAGLARAHDAGIPTETLYPRHFTSRSDYDLALLAAIDGYRPDLVVLAGFMRILSAAFVEHYAGRLLNIHPSLLPDYKGLATHERVLADNVDRHGSTVHFVSAELDSGAPLLQAVVPVLPGDDVARLSARVQSAEHIIYPLAVEWIANDRVALSDGRVFLDGAELKAPVTLRFDEETTSCEPVLP